MDFKGCTDIYGVRGVISRVYRRAMINRPSCTMTMINRCAAIRDAQKDAAKNTFCPLWSPSNDSTVPTVFAPYRQDEYSRRALQGKSINTYCLALPSLSPALARVLKIQDDLRRWSSLRDFGSQLRCTSIIIASRCSFAFNTDKTMSLCFKESNEKNRVQHRSTSIYTLFGNFIYRHLKSLKNIIRVSSLQHF